MKKSPSPRYNSCRFLSPLITLGIGLAAFLVGGFPLTGVCGTAVAAPLAGTATVPTPRVLAAGLVAPDILGITIEDGTLIREGQIPYTAKQGDEIKLPNVDYRPANTPQLWRDKAFVGWLVDNRKMLSCGDRLEGFLSGTEWLDQAASYKIEAAADPRFSQGGVPLQVFRKSVPQAAPRIVAQLEMTRTCSVRHTIYLRLDSPWLRGVEYRIRFPRDLPPLTLVLSDELESEAIHVTQIGFRPQDEPKVAFLSCWLGTGGALVQPSSVPFQVVDATGHEVLRGTGTITTRATDNESDPKQPRNLNLTDVVLLDFSGLRTPGEYRVRVPGVGSSYPIRISDDVWSKAFVHSMRAFYTQRSGVELLPRHAGFHRPRNMHPADGVTIYQSTCTLMDSNNGLNALGNDVDNFANLVKGATTQVVGAEAWGGYMDAGDWDRRIQHLKATRQHLDLLLEVGAPVEAVRLNIPESGNGRPDLLNEALWNLDFYRRLMTSEGGVRGGIESEEHPKAGEGSWQESWKLYAYAPDVWSSYQFAATAARCAHYAQARHPEVAEVYRTAALKAMDWAEVELARLPESYLARESKRGKVSEVLGKVRNLAAADLYRLTGDGRWNELFVRTFLLRNEEAFWVYLRTERERDPRRLAQCREELLRLAQWILDEQQKVGFRWVRQQPAVENRIWGLFSENSGAEQLVHAWRLTGEAQYRQGAVMAAMMGVGANPNNLTYTSGLGRNPMRNVFYHDTEMQGLEPPGGLTAFGPFNPANTHHAFLDQIKNLEVYFVPQFRAWPQAEFCLDTGRVHPIDEFTPNGTLGPVSYLWGSLAY